MDFIQNSTGDLVSVVIKLSQGENTIGQQFYVGNEEYKGWLAAVGKEIGVVDDSQGNVLVVAANSPWKSLADVIKAARDAKDKKLTYGTPGIGSSPHLTGAYFEAMAGVDLLHVPFKGVSASMPALIGGNIDLLFDNLPGSINQIKDGSRVRGIAVTSAQRSPLADQLPTFAESGVAGFDVTAWFAIYAPKGTPQPVMDKLIEAARAGLKSEKVEQAYAKLAATPGNLFGADLAAFENIERAKWGKLIKERGIKAE
jgi:tripartite-type tricarboxylate transporter receptor subunit TctC